MDTRIDLIVEREGTGHVILRANIRMLDRVFYLNI